MVTTAPSFGTSYFGNTNPGFIFGNNPVQANFGTPTQQQCFPIFGNCNAPAVANNAMPLFTLTPTPAPAPAPMTFFGGNNATTTTPCNVFTCTPPQQQAPTPQLFTQPQQQQQQQSPPPIFMFSNQQQTPAVQQLQPQQNVIQPVQPQQQTFSPPSVPLFPQSIPNPQLYKTFIEEKMGMLIEELRKLESNQLFVGCPNSNPLVGWGVPSPQSVHPQPATQLPYLPCDIGRPSTLALDYVQGVSKKLEAEKNEQNFATRLLWRNNHCKGYPLKSVSSTDFMPHHSANVRRSWGSTCLTDPYRDRHCLNCCCCSQHQLPEVWSPRCPQLLSSPLNDKNYLKQRTQSWRRGYAGYSYSEKDRRPQLNRFRVDGASYSNLDNLYLSQLRGKCAQSHSFKDDIDKKWKTLDANVVRQSNHTRKQHGLEWDAEKRLQSLQPSLKTCGRQFADEIDPRDREDAQMIWQWFRQRRQLTGPPLRSHLDDDDLDLYEKLREEANKMRPERKMVANLPTRFVDWKDNQQKRILSIKSSPPSPPPLLRAKIVKSTCRLLAPTKKRSQICKEEVRTLYRNLKNGRMVTQEESSIDAGSSGVPLTEKTSPVFLSIWKNGRRSTSSTAIQTDKPIGDYQRCFTMRSFTEENENGRQCKETREECTRRLREMDPYQGRLRGRGYRIGEQPPSTQDEKISPRKEEPSTKPCVVTLSKTGYYSIPSIATLNKMAVSKDWNCIWVKDFEIGHKVHGKAVFPGYTNVYGLNFDKIVEIGHKAFELYPKPETEPPFGKGLHKPCTVTLYNVWPEEKTEKGTKWRDETAPSQLITDPETIVHMNFERFLKRCCKNFDGTFLKYCPEHGEWVFQVQQLPSHSVEQPVILSHVDSNEDLS